MSTPMSCPHCSADLRDSEIPREHLEAGYYGPWSPEDGPRYGSRVVGVELPHVYDGCLYFECPDCAGKWHRWPEGHYLRARAQVYLGVCAEGVHVWPGTLTGESRPCQCGEKKANVA